MPAIWIFLSVVTVMAIAVAVFLLEVYLLDKLVEKVNGEYPDDFKFPIVMTLIFSIIALGIGVTVVQWINQWILITVV